MKFKINPHKAVGCVVFGMSHDKVLDVIGFTPFAFMKSSSSDRTTDDFGDFHVYYDAHGGVEAVEFFEGASELFLDDQNLFSLSLEELNTFLAERDSGLLVESDSMISSKYGIAVYAPARELRPDAKAETILIFKKGYYDAT